MRQNRRLSLEIPLFSLRPKAAKTSRDLPLRHSSAFYARADNATTDHNDHKQAVKAIGDRRCLGSQWNATSFRLGDSCSDASRSDKVLDLVSEALLISRRQFQVEPRCTLLLLSLIRTGVLLCSFAGVEVDRTVVEHKACRFLSDELIGGATQMDVVPVTRLG